MNTFTSSHFFHIRYSSIQHSHLTLNSFLQKADEFAIKRFSPQEREAIAQWFSDEQFRQLTRDTYSRAMISPSHFAVTIFKLLRSHPDPSVRASHIRQLEQQPPLDKLPTST
jgi:hypothetical protein